MFGISVCAITLICVLNGIQINGLSDEQRLRLSDFTVVYPQIVHQKWKREADPAEKQEFETDRVTYSFNIGGRNRLLRLEKNNVFLAEDFVVHSYDSGGKLKISYPKVKKHCHYRGYVEGQEDSLVILSTCLGLKGVLFIGNETYGIEPASQSATNEHFLYPLKWDQDERAVCGVTNETPASDGQTHEYSALSMTKLFRKKRNLPQTRYVELVLVADKNRYDFLKGNMTAVEDEMVSLAALLDGYFQQLNIRVVLVGLEVFSSGNPFSVNGTAGDVLSSFASWRQTDLLQRIQNDAAQLVVGLSSSYPGGILGMAFVGTVCSASASASMMVFSGSGLSYYSTVSAHELGHNLGLNHDNTRCTCNGSTCIMDAYATGSTLFSTCSSSDFETLVLRGGGLCLLNMPPPSSVYTVPTCGNGIVEQNEQCDCGTPQECTNVCCDAATCQFSRGSTCAQGSCCQNCQVLVAGTPCRPSVNVCDLPEYCTGQTGSCPLDYYIVDGFPCQNSTAYCYEGRCQTYDFQCQKLFGSSAQKAADICFTTINGRGDEFGNCGTQSSGYIKCSVANAFCGKVQCTNVNANYPPQGSIISVQQIQGVTCVNAFFDLGTDVQDPAYVSIGSGCANGMTCLDFQCANASEMKPNITCDPVQTCHNNGMCNNLGNCHCYNGWGPPYCDRAGFGGSINSGPAEIDYSVRNGLLIFFLLVVPILIAITVGLLYVFKRDWFKPCSRKKLFTRSPNVAGDRRRDGAQRSATPQNERPQQTMSSYPGPLPSAQPKYGEESYGSTENSSPAVIPTAYTQGPGVPRPIPPRQVVNM